MESTTQNKESTQLHKANLVLKGLAINVTAGDKKDARTELNLSRYTVNDALKGKAKDLDTATDLVKFFKTKISEREKEFSQ